MRKCMHAHIIMKAHGNFSEYRLMTKLKNICKRGVKVVIEPINRYIKIAISISKQLQHVLHT